MSTINIQKLKSFKHERPRDVADSVAEWAVKLEEWLSVPAAGIIQYLHDLALTIYGGGHIVGDQVDEVRVSPGILQLDEPEALLIVHGRLKFLSRLFPPEMGGIHWALNLVKDELADELRRRGVNPKASDAG